MERKTDGGGAAASDRYFGQMGFSGFFMHSRTGLETEYLGEEWFRLINRCADYAAEKGMEAWLYDEDRWPSGSAGGMVTKTEEYRASFLEMREYTAQEWAEYPGTEKDVASFAIVFEEGDMRKVRPLKLKELPEKGETAVVLESSGRSAAIIITNSPMWIR